MIIVVKTVSWVTSGDTPPFLWSIEPSSQTNDDNRVKGKERESVVGFYLHKNNNDSNNNNNNINNSNNDCS